MLFVQLLTAEIILRPQNRRHCRVLSHIPFPALISYSVTLIICEENYTERQKFLNDPIGCSKGTPGGLWRTGKLGFCVCIDIFRWCNCLEIIKKLKSNFFYFFKKNNNFKILLSTKSKSVTFKPFLSCDKKGPLQTLMTVCQGHYFYDMSNGTMLRKCLV